MVALLAALLPASYAAADPGSSSTSERRARTSTVEVPADIVGGAQLDDGYTHRRTPSRSLVEEGSATGETPAG